LVRAGKAPEWSGFQPRHPRTAIGWNKDFIFLVVVDGRQGDISVGMTFPELCAYLVKLGCDEAMNFDGGGSVTLWAMGQVMNSPSEGRERPSANTLAVVHKTRHQGESKQNVPQRHDSP
jgi:exopolysaccharide biosynthesis protein